MSRPEQKAKSAGLGNIFGSFFFALSKANVMNVNLTKLFLIYASLTTEFHSTQNLTKRIFLINGGLKYCIKIEKTTINFLSSKQKEYM